MAAALTRRRQVVLFLVAVVLPSTVLVALGIRLISQDGEIQRSRLADDRRATLSEASRLAIAELEDVEALILASLDESLSLPSRAYPHPAVRFVARVEKIFKQLRLSPHTASSSRSVQSEAGSPIPLDDKLKANVRVGGKDEYVIAPALQSNWVLPRAASEKLIARRENRVVTRRA